MTKKTKKPKNRNYESPPSVQSSPTPTSTNSISKKRRRSPPKEQSSIVPHVISWLEKRKKKIPASLKSDGTSPTLDSVLLLLGLRERERRALIRHVEKCISNKNGEDTAKEELMGSDGEYDIKDAHDTVRSSDSWPSNNVEFSNNYRWDESVPRQMKEKYSQSIRQRAPRLSNKVYFKRIEDPNHPAYGEFGLYCAITHAPPGSWLLDYVGHITLGEDQDKTSDYVSDFGEMSELACDANNYGNEARFLNDYRNTGKYPNVEFNKRRDKNGELRQGVYVKLAKDARQDGFDGVRKDEQLLVSYGKSYWRSRVGNLTDFVWRIPGQPMPEAGKPPAEVK